MYRVTRFRLLFLISIILYSMNPSFCQEEESLSLKERRELAMRNIKKLQDGVLVVRLQSQQNKIETLQEMLGSGELNDKTEQKIKQKLEGTKAKTESFNKSIMAAFHKEYRFSDFLFILDTASVSLKNGAREGIFLNKDLEIDPALKLDDRPFFVLRFGSTNSNNGQSIEAMVVMDKDFDDLLPPFPYYTRINNFDTIMGGLFPKPKQEQKNANRMVKNLNQRFFNY